jgi:hypothetical protein
MHSLILSIVAVMSIAGVVQTPPETGIAGKWQVALETDGGPRQAVADFKVEGEKVTGTWDTTDVQGTFKDGTLSLAFPFSSAEGGINATLTITGKLEGETITGTWVFSDYSGKFTATRAKA